MQTSDTPGARPPRDKGALPPIVDAILAFYYGITWLYLVGVTLGQVAGTRDEQYGFLIPAALYGALLLSFVVRNARRYWTTGGNVSDWLWGYDDQFPHILAFLLASFALIAILSAGQPAFVVLYFALYGHTWGMLAPRWRLAGALCVAEIVAQIIQVGLPGLILRNGPAALTTPDMLGYAIYTVVISSYFILLGTLMTSRIASERLVRELQATKARLETALATEREVGVLRERTRLAREMHDVLGHALGLVAVKIEAAQRLQAVDPARAAAELEATKELVRQSAADLRASLAGLRSPALETGPEPLDRALQGWAERTAREAGLTLAAAFAPEAGVLPAPIQDAFWQVGREAIVNVVKHARATRVELHLFCKDATAYLSVSDDGVGIPRLAEGEARLEVAGHYGVRGMRERVEALGGQLTIRPGRAGTGTLLLAQVPLPAAAVPAPAARRSPAWGLRFLRGERP